MAYKIIRKPTDYISETSYAYDLAKTSKYFDKVAYEGVAATGDDERIKQYLYGVAGAKDKYSSAFNQHDYDYLSAEDKASYFLVTMYEDPDSDSYKQAMLYFNTKVNEAIAQETYDSLNGFEKTMKSIGGMIGNAFNEMVLGTVEGLWDFTTLTAAGLAELFNQDEAAEYIKDITKDDTTGVAANRQALAEYAKKYTYLDKNAFWKTANNITTTMAQMVPMIGLNAVAPGVGSVVYYGSMMGNAGAEMLSINPDINYAALLGYTYGIGLAGYSIEKASALFGGSLVDSLLFGKTTGKLTSTWYSQLGLSFLSEGLEESIEEVTDNILYNALIGMNTGEFKSLSMSEILYAGLIGGLVGGIMGTGRLAGTKALSVTADGQLITTKQAAKLGIETTTDFTKAQTISLQERLAEATKLVQTNALADLQTKYSGENLETIKTKHAKEYEKALNTNKEIGRKMSEVVLGLSKIHQMAGDETFAKATRLVEKTFEQQQSLLSNYTSKTTGETTQARIVEQKAKDKLSRETGADVSFTIKTDLTALQMRLKQALKNYYGIDVYFGNIGTSDGVERKFGMTISDHEIILDTEQFGQMSEQEILTKMVKEELVHSLQFVKDVITPQTLNVIRLAMNDEQYKALNVENMTQKLDEAYADEKALTKITEAQAKALAEVLLFDDVTVSKMFYTEYSTLNKIYNWCRNLRLKMEESKELRKQKNKIKYNTLLKSMQTYRDVAAKKLGTAENVNKFIDDFKLSDYEAEQLRKTYLENPNIGPIESYIELAFAKSDVIRSKLANDYGITDYVSAGFTPEFANALESGDIKYSDVYKYIADNTVGTPEATNMLLDVLLQGKNKYTTSIKNINALLSDGLLKTIAYERNNSKTAPISEKTKPLSYSTVDAWAQSNPEQYDKILTKLSTKLADYDQALLVRWLLKNDFDYSMAKSNKVYQMLAGERAKKAGVDYVTFSALESVTEEGESQIHQIEDVESSPEEILLRQEERLDDEKSIDVVKTLQNKIKQDLKTKNPFVVRNEWRNRKDKIIEALGENGKQLWKTEILPLLPAEKSSYNTQIVNRLTKIEKLERELTAEERQLTDPTFVKDLLNTSTPEQLENYIKSLDNILEVEQTTLAVEQQADSIGVKETQKKSKKIIEGQFEFDLPLTSTATYKLIKDAKTQKRLTKTYNGKQLSIFDNVDEDLDAKEKGRILQEAAKQEVGAHEIQVGVRALGIAEELRNICSQMNESEAQGDINGEQYAVASNEMYEQYADVFRKMKPEDYHEIKWVLNSGADTQSRAALNLFMRYAFIKRATQFKDIFELVTRDYGIRVSEVHQFGGLMSRDYVSHSVKSFVTELSIKNKSDIKLPAELILATSPQHKTIEDFVNNIYAEIDALEKQRDSEKDAYKKWLLDNQISQKETTITALLDNDIAGAIDNQITIALESTENVANNLDIVNQVTDKVVQWVIEHAQFGPSGFTGFSKNKIPMSQNMEKVKKFFTTLNSFRYLMMLSNPATAIKNGVSNTLNLGSAMVEDVVLKGFENWNILPNEASQVRYTGEYDTQFKEFVEKHFLDKVKAEAEGDKYTTSQLRKLQQKYAEENDPIKKSKFLSQIQKLERKMLSDKWWVTKRTMQNLTNMLAGSSKLILRDVTSRLKTVYKIKTNENLVDKIKMTNPKLAQTYTSALQGNKRATLQLALNLKLDIVSTDLKKQDSIYYYALRRANETFLKVDNWYTRMKTKLSKNHPAAVYVLDQILPFARVSVNAMSYIIDRSPVGLVKGLVQKFQTQAKWDYQRKEAILNYYKNEYIKKGRENANATGTDFKFTEPEFEKWFDNYANSNLKKALSGDNNLLRQIHKDMVLQGWINDNIGFDNIYARADIMEQLAQGSVGTALMTLGVILAAVTDAFEYDDEDDYLGPAINFGGVKIGLSELSPFATMFSVGAMLSSGKIDDNLGAAFNVIADATILSTLDSAMTYNDGLWDYFKNLPTNLLSQYQPALTKQINKIAMNRKKDKSSSNYGMKLIKSLAANSLIFSWLLPDKINPYTGEPEKYYDTGRWEALFDVVLPIGLRLVEKSDFEKEADRVGAPTTGMSGKFTINGSKISLKGKSKEKYAKYKAEYISNQFNKITAGEELVTVKDKTTNKYKTTTYDKLTAEEKQRVLKNIYTNATEITKIQYWLDQGNSYYTTDKETYLEYKRVFGSSSKIVYKKSWSESKFVEG